MAHDHRIIVPRKTNHLDDLLLAWRANPKPSPHAASDLQIALWKAILFDVTAKLLEGIRWEVIEDPRVKWASQYIRLARGEIRTIDRDLTANVDFILSPQLPPPPLSRKHLAAHDS
jgi:hypothetical protein